MPRLLPPYRPDFTTETTPLLHLLHTTSHLALLTTTLALLLLACALILLLRLCVMWDRWGGGGSGGGGYGTRMTREEKLLKVCEEKGRRVCERRGVWDVGVRGGGEKGVGDVGGQKKLRFVPVVEVIPRVVEGKGKGRECVSESECEDESRSGRTSGRSRSRSLGASEEEWFESTTSWAAESSRRNRSRWERALSAGEMVVVPRRERADWVSLSEMEGAVESVVERVVESGEERGGEKGKERKKGKHGEKEPVVFFGGGSWIRRVRNRSVTLSGSLGVRDV